MANKIVVAITGASGAIYARLLLDKLLTLKEQWQEVSIVMSNNAREVWKTELLCKAAFKTGYCKLNTVN